MNRLARSKENQVFLGVCGGIGEYLNIDPTIIRLIFIVLVFGSFGISVLGYIVASFLMPEKDGIDYKSEDGNYEKSNNTNKNTPIIIGLGLILLGVYLLTERIFPGIFRQLRYLWEYWPVLLILLGLYVIFQKRD